MVSYLQHWSGGNTAGNPPAPQNKATKSIHDFSDDLNKSDVNGTIDNDHSQGLKMPFITSMDSLNSIRRLERNT
ncbi:hypothetical protein [Zobellia uliginosa]|uniref:hypothetical protein n=1 Tax=Zobellia uliginosa TaxID=143224 RepID=UPI001115587C|nr:hypothetical protein [Zobellia uliginosa]